MSGQWKEVVRLRFKGERFRDHALDLGALTELSQFQKMIAETAKELWRAANPDRERLPRRFEERTRLCLRKIEEGSATAPLEVYVAEEEQREFWEAEPTEIKEAIALANGVFEAVERDSPLPERFPKKLLTEYVAWGQSLAEGEELEVQPTSGKRITHVTQETRERLRTFCEAPHQDYVDVYGEVLEADVKQKRFQLWIDERTPVTVMFSDQQEAEVTTALKEHVSLRMQVKGQGEMSPQGKLLRIIQVDELKVRQVGEIPFDRSARPIEEVLADLASEVSETEWAKLPSDLTDNLDHYLYGLPKR